MILGGGGIGSVKAIVLLFFFNVKILLFLVNTLIIKFDHVISNWFLFKIYC